MLEFVTIDLFLVTRDFNIHQFVLLCFSDTYMYTTTHIEAYVYMYIIYVYYTIHTRIYTMHTPIHSTYMYQYIIYHM